MRSTLRWCRSNIEAGPAGRIRGELVTANGPDRDSLLARRGPLAPQGVPALRREARQESLRRTCSPRSPSGTGSRPACRTRAPRARRTPPRPRRAPGSNRAPSSLACSRSASTSWAMAARQSSPGATRKRRPVTGVKGTVDDQLRVVGKPRVPERRRPVPVAAEVALRAVAQVRRHGRDQLPPAPEREVTRLPAAARRRAPALLQAGQEGVAQERGGVLDLMRQERVPGLGRNLRKGSHGLEARRGHFPHLAGSRRSSHRVRARAEPQRVPCGLASPRATIGWFSRARGDP